MDELDCFDALRGRLSLCLSDEGDVRSYHLAEKGGAQAQGDKR